jgi:hypothetical protein
VSNEANFNGKSRGLLVIRRFTHVLRRAPFSRTSKHRYRQSSPDKRAGYWIFAAYPYFPPGT